MVKDPADVLDRQKCLDALAALRHAKWFQVRNIILLSSCSLMRCIIYLFLFVLLFNEETTIEVKIIIKDATEIIRILMNILKKFQEKLASLYSQQFSQLLHSGSM